MATRRVTVPLVAGLSVVAALALAAAAPARRAADGVTGAIAPVADGVELRLRNSGTTTLLYDRGTVPGGKTLTAASQDGRACRVSGSRFDCGPSPVPPGGAFTITLQSAQPLAPADGPIPVFVSSDGLTDSGPFSIPWLTGEPQPPTPPPAQECACASLTVRATNLEVLRRRVGFTLHWTLGCSGGSSGSCASHVTLFRPTRTDLRITSPRSQVIRCNGECAAGPSTVNGSAAVTATSPRSLERKVRAGKRYAFLAARYCERGRRSVLLGTTRIVLVFAADGSLDRRRSDLDGNGKPDA